MIVSRKNTWYSIAGWVLVIALSSCNGQPQTTETQPKTQTFEIPNTTEEVLEKYDNGLHKNSVYYDKDSREKKAEVSFHENGQPYINRKFQQGVLNGESWSYYKNGKPWSLNTFKNGVYHGKYRTWYDNGQANIEGQYVNGKEDGDWLIFYSNGQLNTRGIYMMGEKVGVWSSYNEDGTLRSEQDYTKK